MAKRKRKRPAPPAPADVTDQEEAAPAQSQPPPDPRLPEVNGPTSERPASPRVKVDAAPADPLREITKWILEGQSEADILDAVASFWPNAQAQPLIMGAVQQLAEAGARVNGDLIKGFAMEGTREVYRKALEVGDHQIALRALKQLVELTR